MLDYKIISLILCLPNASSWYVMFQINFVHFSFEILIHNKFSLKLLWAEN
jgi:hypothetical protein